MEGLPVFEWFQMDLIYPGSEQRGEREDFANLFGLQEKHLDATSLGVSRLR